MSSLTGLSLSHPSGRERKVAIEKELLPYVANLESLAERSHFISEIAYRAEMKEEILWDIIKKIPPVAQYQAENQGTEKEKK